MCDCVKAFLHPEEEKGHAPEAEAVLLAKEAATIVPDPGEETAEHNRALEQATENQSTVKQILIFLFFLASGILLGKYGGHMITEAVSLTSRIL